MGCFWAKTKPKKHLPFPTPNKSPEENNYILPIDVISLIIGCADWSTIACFAQTCHKFRDIIRARFLSLQVDKEFRIGIMGQIKIVILDQKLERLYLHSTAIGSIKCVNLNSQNLNMREFISLQRIEGTILIPGITNESVLTCKNYQCTFHNTVEWFACGVMPVRRNVKGFYHSKSTKFFWTENELFSCTSEIIECSEQRNFKQCLIGGQEGRPFAITLTEHGGYRKLTNYDEDNCRFKTSARINYWLQQTAMMPQDFFFDPVTEKCVFVERQGELFLLLKEKNQQIERVSIPQLQDTEQLVSLLFSTKTPYIYFIFQNDQTLEVKVVRILDRKRI